MGVITISSELGSGGDEIADRVAKALGYEVVDENTSDRILRQYGLTKFKELYDSAPSLLDLVRWREPPDHLDVQRDPGGARPSAARW